MIYRSAARAIAIACASLGVASVGAVSQSASAWAAGWSTPFRFTTPRSADVGAAQLAVSPWGQIAVGYYVFEEDRPDVSHGYLVARSPGGRLSSRSLGKQVLSVAFADHRVAALVGASPPDQPCCQAARLVVGGRSSTVVNVLEGATIGRLVELASDRLLIAIASGQGVWAAQSRPGGGAGAPRRLTPPSAIPWTVAAAPVGDGGAELGWLASRGAPGESSPRRVMVGRVGAGGQLHPSPLYTAVGGRRVVQLALAARGSGVSAAWIETWFTHGAYHSAAVLKDLGSGGGVRMLDSGEPAASGLSFSGGSGGQVLAFKLCSRHVHCSVDALVRGAGRGGGTAVRLGAIDAGQTPATAFSTHGTAVVGWVDGGHVFAAWRRAGARGRWRHAEVSGNAYAADLTLACAGSEVAAAWTEGTLAPVIAGAVMRGA